MKFLKQTSMRCSLSQSNTAETIPGFLRAWTARSVMVLVEPHVELQLNEQVIVKFESTPSSSSDCSISTARLHSRVVSILWQDAGNLVGLAVHAVKTAEPNNSGMQSGNRTRWRTAS